MKYTLIVRTGGAFFFKIFLALLFCSLIFPLSVHAQEMTLNPTEEYTTHSSPESTLPQKKEEIHTVDYSPLPMQIITTASQASPEKNVFSTLVHFSAQLERVTLSLSSLGLQYGKDHVTDWIVQLIIPSLVPGNFSYFNSSQLFFAQHILKSTYDMYARILIVGYSFSHATTDRGWNEMYSQITSQFEQMTHWQLGPLNQDLIWFGATALVVGLFFGQEALLAHPEVLTGISASLGANMTIISKYITKETKSAFTETEKECKEREDNCANLEDKGIILLFNYLPGNMPDLGLDDFVIGIKNKFLRVNNR